MVSHTLQSFLMEVNMFYAYSIKQQKVVCAQSITDLNDTFMCLNDKCNAELSLKSINGKRKAHFCAKPSKPHVHGCIYGTSVSEYSGNDFVKVPLNNIYHRRSPLPNNKTNDGYKPANQRSDNLPNQKYIRTPISLLNFCMAHHLEDEYLDGLTVNDIILSNSNLCYNANFEGIKGLRLVIGNTYKYDPENKMIVMKVTTTTSRDKHICLRADILLSPKQFSEINEYLFNIFGKQFKGHSIAVLEEWKTVDKYHISCRVQSPKNVIYKFVHDV